MSERAVIVAGNKQQLDMALSALVKGQENAALYNSALYNSRTEGNTARLAMLFTGQGSQYKGMGKSLYSRWPVFKQVIDECATYLDGLMDVSLHYLLFDASESELQQTRYAQPVIFVFDYALYRLWQSWGIEPDVVMGHSLGEYVAACVAGVFNLQDAICLVAARAELMQQVSGDGAMLAVAVDSQQLKTLLSENQLELELAAINSPRHCVLSGKKTAIELARKKLESKAIYSQLLQVSHAFHSQLIQSMLSAFGDKLSALCLNKPYLPLISNVTGQQAGDEICTPDYWLQHCRQPVLFADSVKVLQDENCQIFLECGARPVLSSLLIANAANSEQVFTSVHPDQPDSLLHCAARLYVQGENLKWKQLFQHKPAGRQPILPVYPFSGQRYWLPKQALTVKQDNDKVYLHPLVHRQLDLANTENIYFESDLSIDSLPYLAEHQVYGQYLVPLAVLIEMLLATAQKLLKSPAITVKNLQIEQPFILSAENMSHVQLEVRKTAPQHFAVSVFSRSVQADWQRHITAEMTALNATAEAFNTDANYDQSMSAGQLYQLFKDKKIDYGNSFKVLANIRYNSQSALTQIKSVSSEAGYLIHPTLLDGCMQTAGVAIGETKDNKTWLPVAIEQIDFYQSINNAQCHAQVTARSENASQVDLLLKHDKDIALKITGMSFQAATKASLLAALGARQFDSWLYQPVWHKLDIADFDSTIENRLVLCLGTEQANLLADKLSFQAIQTEVISPEQMLDADFWQSQSPGWLASTKELHCIYCAKDFIGDDEVSASLGFLALIKTLEKQALAAKVTLLTQQASAIGNTLVCPKQNAVIGLIRTAALEFPHRQWNMLDFEQIKTTDVDLLIKTLSTNHYEQQLALHGTDVYGSRLIRCKQNNSATTINIQADKSYLVIGGAGALGFAVVQWLVEQGATCVVIAGRTGLSSLADDALNRLAKNGVNIIGVAADLSQADGGDDLLKQLSELSPLAGVIHAAGALKDGSLLNQSIEDFEVPWQAKVKALTWLDNNSLIQTLDFFVLFSSLAAITGAPGQGNYAAANAYADALMLNRHQQGFPALTINWGGWRGEGMLAETENLMIAKGLDLIEPEQGIGLLQSLLSQSLTQVAVMPVRWTEFFAALPYEVPAFYQQFMHQSEDKTAVVTTSLIQRLNRVACEQRSMLLDQAVRKLIAQVLRMTDGSVLENRQRFFDIGFDSLLAMELTNQLAKILDYQLPSTLLFDYPTLDALLSYLEECLPLAFKAENTETTDNLDEYSDQQLSDLLAQRLASMD